MNSSLDSRMEIFTRYLQKSGMEQKDYQYDGVRWCLNNETRSDPPLNVRGGFIADEMGLGKTIMMIGVILSNIVPRTLIVLPPILIDQWYLQIYRTTGHKPLIYHSTAKKTITNEELKAAKIVITSYGAINISKKQSKEKKVTTLHTISWDRIIFDEAHHLRNSNTSRYFGARLLPASIRWLVSGTPIQNDQKDFYSLCALVRLPPSFYTDDDNLRRLARSFILKRTKKQVGIQIPDIHVEKNLVKWSNQKEMNLSEELHSVLSFSGVDPKKGMNGQIANAFRDGGPLTLLLRIRQSCIYPKLMTKQLDKYLEKGFINDYSSYKEAFNSSSKLDAVCNIILERKDNGCGKLIFCHFREEIDEVAIRLRKGGIQKVATFDGRTSNGKRFDILNEQNNVIILQIQTGCEGLNLQEHYSEIYFIAPHWNPAVENQAIARCHRIGQTKPVYVQRFEMCKFIEETDEDNDIINIDQYINDVKEAKINMANRIIG